MKGEKGNMGLGYEGQKGEKGQKGERGPVGTPAVLPFTEPKGTNVGPIGEPGEKGDIVGCLLIYTWDKCVWLYNFDSDFVAYKIKTIL